QQRQRRGGYLRILDSRFWRSRVKLQWVVPATGMSTAAPLQPVLGQEQHQPTPATAIAAQLRRQEPQPQHQQPPPNAEGGAARAVPPLEGRGGTPVKEQRSTTRVASPATTPAPLADTPGGVAAASPPAAATEARPHQERGCSTEPGADSGRSSGS
ncbi:unnamed protein product, partial [Ectocarpus sp. 12 AP-2014]